MLAIQPPTENSLAARAAILELARAKLAPLFSAAADLDAIPAWLWSLPAHVIARSLQLDAGFFARELALKLDAETERRHPGERYAAYLEEHRPHLSSLQRARLAEFTAAFAEETRTRISEVTHTHMAVHGFHTLECERFLNPARELVRAVAVLKCEDTATHHGSPADLLRAAGERAHARRAFAEIGLEPDAAACGRVAAPRQAARACAQ